MSTTEQDLSVEASGDPQSVLVPRLLTVADAARLLGIGRTTTYELIAAGELDVVHIGRSARVPTTEIDAFVERLRERGEPTSA